MPELRQNRFTKEWVIMATERARRPEDFQSAREPRPPLPSYSEKCPFCLGNEHLAPPAVCEIRTDGRWDVRIVPNKFAALAREGDPVATIALNRSVLHVIYPAIPGSRGAGSDAWFDPRTGRFMSTGASL